MTYVALTNIFYNRDTYVIYLLKRNKNTTSIWIFIYYNIEYSIYYVGFCKYK